MILKSWKFKGFEEKQDMHALVISVAFMIINDPNPVVLDVILERVR